jgi:DNA-binding MarR family transcriptional regulator
VDVANDGSDDLRPGLQEALMGYHLRRASAVFASDFAAATAGTGMRQVLFGILSVVATNPGISQSRVGAALGIQRANMVSLANELTERGLIERSVAPEDRRAFALVLTGAGESVLFDCLGRIGQHEDALLAGLSSAERHLLLRLLQRIHAQSSEVDL